MKKLLLLSAIITASAQIACAQFPYKSVVARQEAYQPLINGISLTNGIYWHSDNYWNPPFRTAVKLPFTFNFGTTPADTLFIINGSKIATDTFGIIPAFIIINADLVDKGFKDKITPLSPIRYETTGAEPNRIFKLEIANAAFGEEYYMFGSMKDSINIQVWLYEKSQVIEFHYGPSSVQGNDPYPFVGGTGMQLGSPTVGYIKEWDHDANDYIDAYMVSGDPTRPYLDSLSNTGGYVGSGLSSYPVNGTVICFGCDSVTGVQTLYAKDAYHVYPTLCTNEMIINSTVNTATSFDVVGMNGAVVDINGMLYKGGNKIDVSSLAPGVYILRIQNGDNRSVHKFIKQ